MAGFKGYRCDECAEIFEAQPKLTVEDLANFTRNVEPYTFCSYDCLSSWAIAQNAKRLDALNGPELTGWPAASTA